MEKQLLVGTGKTEIRYTDEMFPTYGENYTGIHDLPMMQALVMCCGKTVALISVDVVMLEIKEQMLEVASRILKIPKGNILIHATHVLATPHFNKCNSIEEWKEKHKKKDVHITDEEARIFLERENLIVKAHMDALQMICEQARNSLQIAQIGFGETYSAVNVNRVIETRDGWWQGVNQDGPSDHRVPIIRFDDEKHNPIAVLFNCNVAPGCMEFSTVNGGRLVSGDLSGATKHFVDHMYSNNVVSIYTTGFTGDQWQALRARTDYLDKEGKQVITDLQENGFVLPWILGIRLGEQVVKKANYILTEPLKSTIRLESYCFSYDGQKVMCSGQAGPVQECEYRISGKQDAEIKVLILDEICIVFCGVELCSETFLKIKEESPFAHTFLVEFTTNGGGYMPEAIFYDRMSFQSRKSRYAKGSAERFGEDVVTVLKELKN